MSIIKTINSLAKEKTLSTLLSFATFIFMTFFYIKEFHDTPPLGLISKIFIIGLYIFIVCGVTTLAKIIFSFVDLILYFITFPFCSFSDQNASSQYTSQSHTSVADNTKLFSEDELEANKVLTLTFYTSLF